MRLYDPHGRRLYLNQSERRRFALSASQADPATYLLCLVLMLTGCRISEALSLSTESFQPANRSVLVVTLKRRKSGIVREIPLPDMLFPILRKASIERQTLLFPMHRGTAWRRVKAVLECAGIDGPCAMPKGLRHGFAVGAIQSGVPLDLVSRWMGHASLRTTSLYTQAMGPEERAIAARMWKQLDP